MRTPTSVFLLAQLALAGAAVAAPALDTALPAYAPQPVTVPATAGYVDRKTGVAMLGGAEHVAFIVGRFNALFMATHPGVKLGFDGKGTSSAVPLLMHDKILFGAMGRAINPIETVPYRKIVGGDALAIRIAHTAATPDQHLATSLAVYVNVANPLTQLTSAQVSQILSTGNVGGDFTRWGQLGLKEEWRDRVIHPYGTAAYTGFGDYLQRELFQGRALAVNHEELANTEAITGRIAQDPAGIGVAALGVRNPQLRQLAIVTKDGVATTGTDEEVVSGRYPFGRYVYLYVRRVPGQAVDPLAKEYLRMVLSREGQAIIAAQPNGYLPLTAAQAQAEMEKLK
ncbi:MULTISPECIES: PstS family phosphate ABC transporter substrate-binding protein [unclassified Janthinobacterium]|uniref:PstS family phosphate ABC transporter substrate-binding protein n=1 Tax=unclassified Janthinobacterium TaxID=2610881 RepID=UPI00161B4A3C|nr:MULTISPECIES: substrate-binding domain-containing protein [unclassified Janthinobacterium]MBB5369966.1 phosphate transport system substrate-binding protein [Janthinobacterium sp. K2C7]MBB5382772.1 phosphate transport system substrate-binding protein [Janthinobacterium sp. K2Li3]MBB5384757.1 phosphate transport system substrate-binding protein [Janthinobacterium sp. K2E3]